MNRDYVEASRWFQKAAERGMSSAQNNLGVMYKDGQGVSRDVSQAVRWFRTSADQGDADAQANLGGMYVEGLGVAQDYVQAHKWFALAASGFSASKADKRALAIEYRDLVAARMTPAQVAEAQKLAREWKPK